MNLYRYIHRTVGICAVMAVFVMAASLMTACGMTPDVREDSPAWMDSEVTRISVPSADTENAAIVGEKTDNTGKAVSEATKTAVTSNTTAPVKNGETRIHFLAAGDNIIHENVYVDAKNRATGSEKYDFIDMYAGIADMVASADLAFVNQETPLGGDELGLSGYPNFNGPQAVGDALVKLGFDIVNIATNHMLDKKSPGLQGSIDYWNSQPVTLLGGYVDEADYENIRVVEQSGVKIAFLSYTYGLNGMTLSAGSKLYIPLIDQKEIVRMVTKAKGIADLVFVVLHWGTENSFDVDKSQTTLAKAIAEAGADAIIGMHTHTLQPVEWIARPDGGKMLCVYSLGNLLHTMINNYNMLGGILTFDIVKNKAGEIYIENPIIHPTVNHYDSTRYQLQVYLLENYTSELAAAHGIHKYAQGFSVEYLKKLVLGSMDIEFLPDYLK